MTFSNRVFCVVHQSEVPAWLLEEGADVDRTDEVGTLILILCAPALTTAYSLMFSSLSSLVEQVRLGGKDSLVLLILVLVSRPGTLFVDSVIHQNPLIALPFGCMSMAISSIGTDRWAYAAPKHKLKRERTCFPFLTTFVGVRKKKEINYTTIEQVSIILANENILLFQNKGKYLSLLFVNNSSV